MAEKQGQYYYTKEEMDEVEQLTIETVANFSTITESSAYRNGKIVTVAFQGELGSGYGSNASLFTIKDSNGNVIPVKAPLRFGIGQSSSQYTPQPNAFGWIDANSVFRAGYESTAGQWISVVLTFIIVNTEEESE